MVLRKVSYFIKINSGRNGAREKAQRGGGGRTSPSG